MFNRWLGTTESHSNPLVFNIEKHITLAGVFLDTAGLYGFNYRTIPEGFASINSLGVNGTTWLGGWKFCFSLRFRAALEFNA